MSDIPSRTDISSEIQKLVEQYCAGTISIDEQASLERQLRDSPQARLFFVAYLSVHSGIQWGMHGPSLDVPMDRRSNATTDRATPRGTSVPHHVMSRWTASLGYSVLAVSIMAVAVTLFWVFRPRGSSGVASSQEMAVARLSKLQSQVTVERLGVPRNAQVGMELLFNDRLKVPDGGAAFLTMKNSSRMELGPRTILSFEHEGRPELREGFAQIDATERRGQSTWSIRTPEADAEVRGSRFAVGAGPKQTMLRVAEGSVSVSRRRDGALFDVSQGQCSTIAEDVDSHPLPSRYGTALLLVSREERIAPEIDRVPSWEQFNRLIGNRLIGDRLWRLALSVEVRTFDQLEAADIKDRAFVVVSLFGFGEGIEDRLIRAGLPSSEVPILCLEPAAFPVLGMTGPEFNADFGFSGASMLIDIARPEHPLAGGFSGAGVRLFSHEADRALGWAKPAESALKIAHLQNLPDHWMLFAFEKGAMMRDRVAPGRRVGLFLNPRGVDEQSPALKLIDAAIQWCVESLSNRMAQQTRSSELSAIKLPFGSRLPLPRLPLLGDQLFCGPMTAKLALMDGAQ